MAIHGRTAAAIIVSAWTSAVGSAAAPPGVAAFVRDHRLARYAVALTDLNRDGRQEAVIYAMATVGSDRADLCGSGGCTTYLLSLGPAGYSVIATIAITRPPIRLLRTETHGWRDLGVGVAGGGIVAGYVARLRFDGRGYPSNPTMPPAEQLDMVEGEVLIESVPAPVSE